MRTLYQKFETLLQSIETHVDKGGNASADPPMTSGNNG